MLSCPVESTETPVEVSTELYALNRRRLVDAFRGESDVPKGSKILLKGGLDAHRANTDMELMFRQESYFMWCFGINEPDCYGVIDVDSGMSTLFVPRLPEEYRIWMGRIRTPEDYQHEFGVDQVAYLDELETRLSDWDPSVVYVLQGRNTDSGLVMVAPEFSGAENFRVDTGKLFPIITKLRTIKTAHEVDVMRSMNRISSEGHMAVMASVKPGMVEREMEAIFKYWTHRYGDARYLAYTPICASGPNAAVLHYGHAGCPNTRKIEDGDIVLNDMGAERLCYASDITVSFPANGRFTPEQRVVYEAVLEACWAVEDAMAPGVSWPSMHTLAYRVILSKLKEAGVLTGDIEEMMAANLGGVFMPHGLGHLIGLDVHDVGGYPKGTPRDPRFGHRSVRLGLPLEEGMAVTVEPGCYFVDHLIDAAFANPDHAKFLNRDAIERYRRVGGVRIEDNVVVTADSIEVLTVVPRTAEQVEACCRGEIKTLSEIQQRKPKSS